MTNINQQLIYAIYPNSKGYGFVCLSSARRLADYGTVVTNPITNLKILKRVKMDFEYFRPQVVILQDPEANPNHTGNRVKKLIQNIIKIAKQSDLSITQYSRFQIRHVLSQLGAKTKYEISQVLASEFSELIRRQTRKTSIWEREDRNIAIFDALSLGVTWFYHNT